MNAPPGAPAPAPGPPPGVARTLLEFARTEAHDITEGTVDLTMYEVDPNNTGAATSPAALKTLISDGVKDGAIKVLAMIDDQGLMREFHLPAFAHIRTGELSPYNGRFICNIGDFDPDDGNFYSAEITTANMGLANNSVHCCTADSLHTQAQAHTGAARFFVGPYAAADADVEPVHSRKIFEIPYFLISMCGRAAPDGCVTVLYFWTTLYPVIVAKGPAMVTACKALIDAFRLAATRAAAGDTSSVMDTTAAARPTMIGRDDALKKTRKALFRQILAFRRGRAEARQGDALMAASMDNQTDLLRDQFQFAKNQALETKKNKILKSLGGQEQLDYLLEQCGARRINELPDTVQRMIETTSDTARDTLLNNAAIRVAEALKLATPPVFANGFATRVLTEPWHMARPEMVHSGSVYNLLTQAAPEEQAREMCASAKAADPDRTAARVSVGERKALDEAKLFFATPSGAIVAVRHLLVLSRIVCASPATHPLAVWAKDYHTRLAMGGLDVIMRHPARSGDQSLQGVHFQIALSDHLKLFGTGNKALDDDLIFGEIEEGLHWERVTRTMSTLKAEYKLGDVNQAQRRLAGFDGPTDNTIASRRTADRFGLADGSALGGAGDDVSMMSSPPPFVPARAPPAAGGEAGGGGATGGGTVPAGRRVVHNTAFDGELWSGRCRRPGALGAKGNDLIKAAAAGMVEAIPCSKVDANPLRNMCINFHVRGDCVDGCPYSYDHVPYTRAEYEADGGLVPWMDSPANNFRKLTPDEYTTLGLTPPAPRSRRGGRNRRGGGGRGGRGGGGRGGRSG